MEYDIWVACVNFPSLGDEGLEKCLFVPQKIVDSLNSFLRDECSLIFLLRLFLNLWGMKFEVTQSVDLGSRIAGKIQKIKHHDVSG